MSNIDDKLNEVLNIAEEVLDKKEEKNPLEIANEPPKPVAPQNDDVDTVRDAMYYYSDTPDFCGELVEDDPENGSFTSTGPIFDTRWGYVSYIMSGDTWKEVVFEQDIAATSTTTYILDVTADECSENGGTYNILTQICDLGAYEEDNTASDLYMCMDDYCDRYGAFFFELSTLNPHPNQR